MASESELSVDQVKQRKSLRSWFKTVKRKKKKTDESVVLNQAGSEENDPKSSRNVLQRMRHFVKRFSKSTTAKIQVNELYESADPPSTSQGNNEAGDNFSEFYKEHLRNKWLKTPEEPNELMYKTSVEMLSYVWYWGDISRKDAQKQLTDKPNGSFLVRDSETIDNQFTLSFRIGNHTLHYRLKYFDNYWNFEDLKFDTIVEMIQAIINRSKTENFVCYVRVPNPGQPPFPVLLKFPVSRYIKLPSLQWLSKRIIQAHIKDSEQLTCLPVKLREYCKEVTKEIV